MNFKSGNTRCEETSAELGSKHIPLNTFQIVLQVPSYSMVVPQVPSYSMVINTFQIVPQVPSYSMVTDIKPMPVLLV